MQMIVYKGTSKNPEVFFTGDEFCYDMSNKI